MTPMSDIERRAATNSTALERIATAAGRRRDDLGAMLTAFYIVVIVVAGASATALLGWPAHSVLYFSWDLGEPPAAAAIGGLYLASVATFGAALPRYRAQVRVLSIGVLALALPTLWFTMTHRSVFDWSRPQAVAWVILFLSAPAAIAWDLYTPAGRDPSPAAGRGTRATPAAVAIAGAAGASALWVEPVTSLVAAHSPIPNRRAHRVIPRCVVRFPRHDHHSGRGARSRCRLTNPTRQRSAR